MPTIALLKASHSEVSTRNFRRELPATVHTLNPREEAFTAASVTPSLYDGLIISGSSASVLDETAWIREVETAVTAAVDHQLPTLGVCWGAQLLAHALGGTVTRGDSRELGYQTIEQTDTAHPIFAGVEDSFTAFESHTDYITQLPPDGELLAETPDTTQAFSCGSAVGVQFHPEVDYRSATDLIERYSHQQTVPADPDGSVRSWALSEEASGVLRNFVHEQVRPQHNGTPA